MEQMDPAALEAGSIQGFGLLKPQCEPAGLSRFVQIQI